MAMPAWISELGVSASIAVVIIAVWGESIRAHFFKPALNLRIAKDCGEKELISLPGAAFVEARYFRLIVTNAAAYPAAQDVEVLLTELDIRGPDGQPHSQFRGYLPLSWQHQELYSKTRTIGRSTAAAVDLLLLYPNNLKLTPMISPFNLTATMAGVQHFWVTVVARGLNGESKPLRLQVDWDGKWEAGDTEIASHFKIQVVESRI
jgi:hypothetical protein